MVVYSVVLLETSRLADEVGGGRKFSCRDGVFP